MATYEGVHDGRVIAGRARFWNSRVAAARPRITVAETRIPEIPDQSEFLRTWFTHYATHNTARIGDNTEDSRVIPPEPREGSTYGGVLRTSNEALGPSAQQSPSMSRGTPRAVQSPSNIPFRIASQRRIRFEEPDMPQRSVQAPVALPPLHARASQVGPDPERVFRMQENLQRLSSGLQLLISDLQDLRTRIPESDRAVDQTGRLADTLVAVRRRVNGLHYDTPYDTQRYDLNSRPYDLNGDRRAILQHRIDLAHSNLHRAISSRERAANELEASESEVQASRERTRVLERELEREVRSIENLTRLFGSREDVERQGADYESPIGGMFNRAWGRYREREEERSRQQVLREVPHSEDSYLETDLPEVPETPEANEPFGNESWLPEDHSGTFSELRMFDELSLAESPSLIGSNSSILTSLSTTAQPDSTQSQRTADLIGTIRNRHNRNTPVGLIGPRPVRRITPEERVDQVRIRAQRQAQEDIQEARNRMWDRMPAHRNLWREDENPLRANIGRTFNPRATIRHRDSPSGPGYGHRRRSPRRRSAYRAGTQAHADEVLNYPPFSGQIQAIDTTNQMLRWHGVTDSYEEAHTPHQARVVYDSLEDTDEGYTAEGEGKGLDDDNDGRPEPKDREEMTMILECKICYDQIADTACLPCGHLAMCQWCAEKHIPSQEKDRTRPRKLANCPMCRKRVKQKVKIFSG
ncbi:MAG: hypothetical protein M1835_002131 [Candelina submexicana]|nr:MAG: hypothetical protein M1835_002131 [Candelina submexicana]